MSAEVTTLPASSPDRPATGRSSIADSRLRRRASRVGGRRLLLGSAAVLGVYAGVFLLVSQLGRSAASWGAEMAARVHDAIALERAVDVTSPAAPAPRARRPAGRRRPPARPGRPTRPALAPSPRRRPRRDDWPRRLLRRSISRARRSSSVRAPPTPAERRPAQARAGRRPSGTSRRAGPATAPPTARSRARPVSLDQSAWTCPWPAEADAQQVDEQTVVLRVAVRADGRAERVEVVRDPGYGFGPAARQCALGTRFEPARDGGGQPVAALSPPIRVHFFR